MSPNDLDCARTVVYGVACDSGCLQLTGGECYRAGGRGCAELCGE